jgi:hypothetical protein
MTNGKAQTKTMTITYHKDHQEEYITGQEQ